MKNVYLNALGLFPISSKKISNTAKANAIMTFKSIL